MRFSDLPLRYQKQVAEKLAESGSRKGNPNPRAALQAEKRDVVSKTSCSDGNTGRKSEHVLPVDEHAPKLVDYDVRVTDDPYHPSEISWMRFLIGVNPSDLPTAQQKGIGRGRGKNCGKVVVYTKSHIKAWRKAFVKLFERRKTMPFEGRFGSPERGVRIEITFKFPFPIGTPFVDVCENAPMVQRPDCDNLAKMIVDTVVSAGILPDDSFVTTLHVEKARTMTNPCVSVVILRDSARNLTAYEARLELERRRAKSRKL